jgi:hypothetical protein
LNATPGFYIHDAHSQKKSKEKKNTGNICPCRQPHLLLLSSILLPATAALPLSSAAEFRPGGNLGLVFYLIKPKSPLPSNLSVVR